MGKLSLVAVGAAMLSLAAASPSSGALIIFTDPSGLSAEAEFTLEDGGNTMVVRLKNTSTGVPGGFSNSDQILTGISWDFGEPGPAGVQITGGTVMTGPTSESVNFDVQDVGPNEDVSGEYGYSNNDMTGLLQNFITATQAQSTPFGGANLDGPTNIDGPEAGLISSAFSLPLGGLGVIRDEIIARLDLSSALSDLSFLDTNGTRVEFGSDAFFINGVPAVPGPAALGLLAIAGIAARRRRRA